MQEAVHMYVYRYCVFYKGGKSRYVVDILSPVCSISPWNIRWDLQSVKRSSRRAAGW